MPRLLDLFSGQGGAGAGYARAGFEVVGVDIAPQARYPFEFVRTDALEFVATHGADFDVIHASPPCQAYSVTRHTTTKSHPDLIAPTRAALRATGRPYVIENVAGAPLLNPLRLCGSEFGLTAQDLDGTLLQIRRHRLFESNVWLMGAGGCYHNPRVQVAGVEGNGPSDNRQNPKRGGYTPLAAVRGLLLDIDWMSRDGLSQAVPPAYTAFVGEQLLAYLEVATWQAL